MVALYILSLNYNTKSDLGSAAIIYNILEKVKEKHLLIRIRGVFLTK